jgi:hypothetical protein
MFLTGFKFKILRDLQQIWQIYLCLSLISQPSPGFLDTPLLLSTHSLFLSRGYRQPAAPVVNGTGICCFARGLLMPPN